MATGSKSYLLADSLCCASSLFKKMRRNKKSVHWRQGRSVFCGVAYRRRRSVVGVWRSLALERRRKNADDSNAVCRPRQMKRPTRK
jgi:hypothetical protein